MSKVLRFMKISLLFLVLIAALAVSTDLHACPLGDLSGNCIVGLEDLRIFTEQWLDAGGTADLDDANGVNMIDFAIFATTWQESGIAPIVINEIHYDPDLKTEQVEFVELYNAGDETVDLSGWYFSRGIDFTFPPGTSMEPDSYFVVAQDTNIFDPNSASDADFVAKFGFEPNGIFTGRLSNDGENVELRNAQGFEIDQVDYQLGFPWPTVGDAVPDVPPGGTGHSIQLTNPDFDNDLGGAWRSASPTPRAQNTAVLATNIPPRIRQVNHSPQQPTSGQVVTVTCKVTDPNGVASVTLHYQLVDPGSYIPFMFPNYSLNPAYEDPANWSDISMYDGGAGGDQIAGDDIYSVQMSAGLQTNRRLVRYRITVQDNDACAVTVPYTDDPQPNFAYFVYDGVPAWSGAVDPGSSDPCEAQVVTYGTDVMRSLPVYHLISREDDVINCQYNKTYDNGDYRFAGTMVYDGKVYDHILYRVRGQYSTFFWGKNKWKFNFNRGHYFEVRDDYGERYKAKWNKMNVGTGACPWWQYPHPDGTWDVGTAGMLLNECLSFRFYNMADVPACKSTYFHFRVIDDAVEANPSDQYDGDFWGLYFGFEHADGAFVEEHDLPDGNIYKMDGSPYDQGQTNQGPTEVTDGSDVVDFVNTYNSHPSLSWWQANVDLAEYYSYKAVGIAINNSDPRPEENCLYYHNPVTNQWKIMPWDLDLTYEWATHYTDWEHLRYCLDYQQCIIANRNRSRELLDLLFSSDQAS